MLLTLKGESVNIKLRLCWNSRKGDVVIGEYYPASIQSIN